MGLGAWKERKVWPIPWVKTVENQKVFGIILAADYKQILKLNWEDQLSKLTKTLASWAPRILENVRARAEALRVFALSQIWYRAQVLPLPKDYERRMSDLVLGFLWRGMI